MGGRAGGRTGAPARVHPARLATHTSFQPQVNSQYTGVLYITTSLVFYSDSAVEGTVESGSIPDAIIPLSDPTLSSNPWGYMGIQGNDSKVANFTFPRPDIVGAKLDLYASGHGCEEFWYSNVPGNYSGQLGIW